VIYVDNYGNVVSNITKKLFDEIGKGRPFKMIARGVEILNIYRTYSDAINFNKEKGKREEEGKKLAIFLILLGVPLAFLDSITEILF